MQRNLLQTRDKATLSNKIRFWRIIYVFWTAILIVFSSDVVFGMQGTMDLFLQYSKMSPMLRLRVSSV